MSISTKIAIQLNRLAIAIAKHCRNGALKKLAASNKEFNRVHEERRAALRQAEERQRQVIAAAARQAEADKEKASAIAEARSFKIADKESKLQADLYELTNSVKLD